MVVLRCTQQLLRRLGKRPQADVPESGTRLGDWYGILFQVGRRRYALFMAEHTRLPILLEGADLRRLPDSLRERQRAVLTALGVEPSAIAAENAAMGDAVFAPTRSRSLLGSLNDFVSMARGWLGGGHPGCVLDVSLDLAETPVGPLGFASPATAVRDRLGRQPVAGDGAAVELVVTSVRGRTARCRRLGDGETVLYRAERFWEHVPGEIMTVRPWSEWEASGSRHLAGELVSTRVDAPSLGLTPLRLERVGEWNPLEEYWGEDGDPIEEWAKPIIARGPRPMFEMEQILPGEDSDDPDGDPICRANDLWEVGDDEGARDLLMDLCEADLRCLDAHAHLANLLFDAGAEFASRHFEMGVRIGDLSLGDGFAGVLPWGHLDNRPFLRCLYGYGLCLWRLERFDEAAAVFERLLWLNPTDNQGARFVISSVRAGREWEPEPAGR